MNRLVLGILALPAMVAFAADPTPEEAYKKVVDAYSAAKTIHLAEVKSDIDEGKGSAVSLVTSLWIVQGDRVRLDVTGNEAGKDHKMQVICDGSKLAVNRDGQIMPADIQPKSLGALVRSSLLKGGMAMAIRTLGAAGGWKDCAPSDFKALGDTKVGDRAATGIAYSLKFKDGGHDVTLGITLTLDKETWKILKSEIKDSTEGAMISETYPTTEFDTDPPADAFKLPDVPVGPR